MQAIGLNAFSRLAAVVIDAQIEAQKLSQQHFDVVLKHIAGKVDPEFPVIDVRYLSEPQSTAAPIQRGAVNQPQQRSPSRAPLGAMLARGPCWTIAGLGFYSDDSLCSRGCCERGCWGLRPGPQ
jgi:hypothetical protein